MESADELCSNYGITSQGRKFTRSVAWLHKTNSCKPMHNPQRCWQKLIEWSTWACIRNKEQLCLSVCLHTPAVICDSVLQYNSLNALKQSNYGSSESVFVYGSCTSCCKEWSGWDKTEHPGDKNFLLLTSLLGYKKCIDGCCSTGVQCPWMEIVCCAVTESPGSQRTSLCSMYSIWVSTYTLGSSCVFWP